MNQQSEYKELAKIIDLVSQQNSLQKKRIRSFIDSQSSEYFKFSENLSSILNHNLMKTEDDKVKAASYYNKMCKDFLSAQIQFKKTGKYPVTDAREAQKNVYNEERVMKYYMIGLLLSYMFWPNHYKLFQFFLNNLPTEKVQSYLEVGVGHGLFTSNMQKLFPGIDTTIIDISQTSINTAKDVLNAFDIKHDELTFIHGDFLELPSQKRKFDFVIMGEVLEHVNNGLDFMKKTRDLLNPNGTVFLTTAANSPALDHVLHFHNVDEIRKMISDAGLKILTEVAFAAESIPEKDWEKELVTINYGAILSHKTKQYE